MSYEVVNKPQFIQFAPPEYIEGGRNLGFVCDAGAQCKPISAYAVVCDDKHYIVARRLEFDRNLVQCACYAAVPNHKTGNIAVA
jgi:hypothetical protein